MSVDMFLSRLKGVRRSGRGWVALCPAHTDRNPSLSLDLAADGRILVKCHRGCTLDAILAAAGSGIGDLFPHGPPLPAGIQYDYRDAEGDLLYRVVRRTGKQFSQCRPDPNGGWIWNLRGVDRTLYRLPELIAAVAAGETIFVPEGEKDVEALRAHGLAATCNSGGAGKWPREPSRHLAGASVVLLPDNDEPGLEHARMVAEVLAPIAADIRLLVLPGLGPRGDVSDWLAGGGTVEELQRLVGETAPLDTAGLALATGALPSDGGPGGGNEPEAPDAGAPGSKTKETPASMILVGIGQEAELFHTDRDEPFARFSIRGRKVTHSLRSRPFADWLSLRYFELQGRPPATEAIRSATSVLGALAAFDGVRRRLSVRVAGEENGQGAQDGAVWYDLCDNLWRAIRIRPEGWEIVDEPPILFRRYSAMAEQSEPERGGSIEELRPFLNIGSDGDWRMLVVWLTAALIPGIAHPMLVIHGEQGSSKSTSARLLGMLIDPSLVALRAEPRELAEWIQAADHSWLTTLDNVSRIPVWLSDALCRAVTGEAFLRRALYTNDDDFLMEFQRVVMLTGIETVVQRPDLLDRSILLGLEPISFEKRRSETQLREAFLAARPRLFGALLDLVSGVLRVLPEIRATTLPRLADFARVGLAVEKVMGWPANTFRAAHNMNAGVQNEEAITSSPIGDAVAQFSLELPYSQDGVRYWHGSPTDLLQVLSDYVRTNRPQGWPRDARSLSGQLRRLAPNLRAAGIQVDHTRSANARTIVISRAIPGYVPPGASEPSTAAAPDTPLGAPPL